MRGLLPTARSPVAAVLTATFAACGGPQQHSRQVKVAIESTPPGAMVTVSDGAGVRALGRTPLEHDVEYEEAVYENRPGMWIATGISAAMGVVGLGMLAAGTDAERVRGSDGSLSTADDGTLVGVGAALGIASGTLLLSFLPLAIVGSALDGDVVWSQPKDGPKTYSADLAGYRDASSILDVRTPPPWRVDLALAKDDAAVAGALGGLSGEALGGVVGGGIGVSGLVARGGPAPFVAVFDVEDRTGLLDRSTIATLTDQLSTKLTEHRAFRVVPAQDLRARLVEAKKASYGACIDERCQIELGKAVAADRTLAVRVMQVGAICTVNGVVYDLATEATERAASIRGGCGKEALLDGIEALAAKLSAD